MATANSNDLASILENVRQRVASYAADRKQLADNLREIVSQAQTLLGELGESAAHAVEGRRRGRPPGSGTTTGRRAAAAAGRVKRTMSATARKAISDAQKRRWAKQKSAAKKTS